MNYNSVSVKTNFTSGQLSSNLFGRGDLGIYANGARRLENVNIYPTGGLSRRKGLKLVEGIATQSRLISFEFNTEQTYLLSFENNSMRVYKNQQFLVSLDTPWTAEQLKNINFTQSADTLLVVHPDVEPQQISRNNNEVWTVGKWDFFSKDGFVYCPYYNYYQKKEKITPTGTTGTIQLNAANPIFDSSFIGSRIRINGGEGKISAYNTPNQVILVVSKNLDNANISDVWEESAFSPKRGYPISVTFHQDRMVIGGARSLPNHLWLSKSSDLFNFDIGKGLDDESIDFSILSDQVNAIINVVSTRHLLVFTTGAEWMVSGEPLTPVSIKLNRQTNVGSYNRFSLSPQNIDGATLFLSKNGKQLREFLYTDVEQAYQARDLTLLSSDIIKNPTDITYHQDESALYVVLDDGTVSCLTSYRVEEVNAWSKLRTQGKFLSVAVIGDDVYFCIERNNKFYIEVMDVGFQVDYGCKFSKTEPSKIFDSLEILEGKSVAIIADGINIGELKVINGCITLHEKASNVVLGLPYEHIIEPLPYVVDAAKPYPPKAMRVINSIFRLMETQSFRINLGQGYFDVPLKNPQSNKHFDATIKSFTGDVQLNALGWIRDVSKPMWSIKSSTPCAFTLLSVISDVKIK